MRKWKPRPLEITPVETVEQLRAARYVCTAGFRSVEAAEGLDLSRTRLRDRSPLDGGGHLARLGWWGERVVGHVGVVRLVLRIGRARLELAGIAGVCADPRARNGGVASALMRDALKASKEAGIAFSLLFGIRDYYHRFGFVPAFARRTVTVRTKELPDGPRWRVRKARPTDVPAILEQYDRLCGALDLTIDRNPEIFARRKQDIREMYMLQGKGRGEWAYASLRPGKVGDEEVLLVREAGGAGKGWPGAVLAFAARQAIRDGREKVVFPLPAAHPVSGQLMLGDATATTEYRRNSAAMACVLDFAGVARQMAPEWCARIAAAGAAVPRNGLTVRFRDEYYRWWPDRGDGRTEPMAAAPRRFDVEFNDALARLVMGHGEPEAIMGHYGMQAREAVMPIVRAAFAARVCAYSPVDDF